VWWLSCVQRPRSFLARVHAPAQLLVLPRREFERMAVQAPALATLLQARNPLAVACQKLSNFCAVTFFRLQGVTMGDERRNTQG